MTKQVRDWHKDMNQVSQFMHAMTLHNDLPHDVIEPTEVALHYWLQQYAAEKERAERLLTMLVRIKRHIDEFRALTGIGEEETVEEQAEAFNRVIKAEKERADKLQTELSEYTEANWKAFEREKKLREAIEKARNRMGERTWTAVEQLFKTYDSLYKEEEAK